jgi:hypothetical protein
MSHFEIGGGEGIYRQESGLGRPTRFADGLPNVVSDYPTSMVIFNTFGTNLVPRMMTRALGYVSRAIEQLVLETV